MLWYLSTGLTLFASCSQTCSFRSSGLLLKTIAQRAFQRINPLFSQRLTRFSHSLWAFSIDLVSLLVSSRFILTCSNPSRTVCCFSQMLSSLLTGALLSSNAPVPFGAVCSFPQRLESLSSRLLLFLNHSTPFLAGCLCFSESLAFFARLARSSKMLWSLFTGLLLLLRCPFACDLGY